MTRLLNRCRRRLIAILAGRMEVCMNMTVVDGYLEYSGRNGGALLHDNQFLRRATLADE